jgi:SAM-dependent methyltransferase
MAMSIKFKLEHDNVVSNISHNSYVGTDSFDGLVQFSILKSYGMCPNSLVLEIGCGALNAAIPIIDFLDVGNYTGIDPNEYLRFDVLKNHENLKLLVDTKESKFLSVDDFDPRVDFKFDYIYGHSILSHTSDKQFTKCVSVLKEYMHKDSIALMSFRLVGSPGYAYKQDHDYTEWQYPGVSFFTESFIDYVCDRHKLAWRLAPEVTNFFIKHSPAHYHDWIEFSCLPT